MSHRVPLQQLRGAAPVMLEVQTRDLVRKPISMLNPENVCDLLAMADLTTLPAALRVDLEAFREKFRREAADLPDGPTLLGFLKDYGEVPPAYVPNVVREALAARQEEHPHKGVAALLETWEAVPAAPFEVGARAVRVQRAEAAPPPTETMRKGVRAADDPTVKAPKAPRAAREPREPKAKAAPVVLDVERQQFVDRALLARLEPAREAGLLEVVLLAGVKREADKDYPDMTPAEILGCLRRLKGLEQVRYSAGRWRLAGVRW